MFFKNNPVNVGLDVASSSTILDLFLHLPFSPLNDCLMRLDRTRYQTHLDPRKLADSLVDALNPSSTIDMALASFKTLIGADFAELYVH